MNIRQENKEDILKQYLNSEMVEKAPEGFTTKVMTRIQIDTLPAKARENLLRKSKVPVISTVIALALIIAAFILPAGSNELFSLPGLKLMQSIDLPAIKINFDTLFSFNMPDWLPYLLICILILSIFDRGLYGLFHRGK